VPWLLAACAGAEVLCAFAEPTPKRRTKRKILRIRLPHLTIKGDAENITLTGQLTQLRPGSAVNSRFAEVVERKAAIIGAAPLDEVMSLPPGQPNSPRCSAGGPAPQFLIRLEPRVPSLFGNLAALLRRTPNDPCLEAGPFWTDVFVGAGLPWRGLLESVLTHGVMVAAIWSLSQAAWLNRPQVIMRPQFQHSQIVYFKTSEYLPPIKTASPRARVAHPADPAYAPQEIISVPPEADNRNQTIVTPPDVKLSQEMSLPNLVSWTPSPGPVPVPGSLNSKLTLPQISTPVIPPPPEVARANDRAASPVQQASVIAPPPDVADTAHQAGPALAQPTAVAPAPENTSELASVRALNAPQPAVVPPPVAAATVTRTVGTMNVAELQPQVSAPKLPLSAQQTASDNGAATGGVAGQAESSAAAPPDTQNVVFGRPSGQLVALGLSPSAVSGPISIPEGNRRGIFAAGPSGHAGASGTPAANSGGTAEAGIGSSNSPGSDKLAGISVAPGTSSPANTGAPVVASLAPGHNLMALARVPSLSPRVTTETPSIAPSEIDREVFGHKKFYSVTLNMPNLNSRSGSWVIRFAELNQDDKQGDLTAPVVVEKVDPAYPGILMREHVEGTVTLYAVIGTDGNVAGVRVLRGVEGRLDAAARDALSHCHFRPATKNGLAVALEAVIRIPFEVHRIPY